MSDTRFSRLKNDPRFRRPRKKESRIIIDDRFKAVFALEKSKKKSTRIDKYGRPTSDTHEKDNLKRFYRLETHEEGAEHNTFPDYARGEVLLESSDEEENGHLSNSSKEEEDIEHDDAQPTPILDEDAEIDLDETEFADLDAQAVAYAEANPENHEQEGNQTNRLAVVNLDWDHVRASHLFKICSSLVSPTAPMTSSSSSQENINVGKRQYLEGKLGNVVRGRVLSVRIYPSDFGKARMLREETEGPPPEIFRKKKSEEDEVNAQNIYDVTDEDDYDKDALRKYQLERLRYYYAIITCDTVDAATHIYRELEGTELERSANVFDLSYVPEDMLFDGEFRDEATDDSSTTYKASFTDFDDDQALRHSKVKLTWDEDDPERNQITRRTLSKKEIEDADFRAYLASSSESESEVIQSTKSKGKKASRNKIRALLLGGGDDLPEGWGHEDEDTGDIDMEITFTPGLAEKDHSDETTLDKYQRKMREKRKRKKDEVKEKSQKSDIRETQDGDDFFDLGSDDDAAKGKDNKGGQRTQRDPEAPTTRPLSTPEELALLAASDDPRTQSNHFNLKSVLKAEKKARRKGKKNLKGNQDEGDNEVQADFTIDVKDERFKVLHEDHQYAIDPTNPHFKKTVSMDAFLKERQRRQKEHTGRGLVLTSNIQKGGEEKNLARLVESVKRKSAVSLVRGTGKRRKI
ncbi:hypothetical protein H0H81_011206 [Sphagnurus paluster]|uniref:NUC153 domain-containing protein n=1 Tax=Sphagnurus paluster TaxID=117069 RepID=A0A9P7K711_9AGAR|nr:hypothetical protein H0H81_011206 [Sphagnurus paluster]